MYININIYYRMSESIMNPANVLRTRINFNCPICFCEYDNGTKQPIIVCTNQHTYCSQCTDALYKTSNTSKCPQCRLAINKNNKIVFRFMNQIRVTSNQLRLHGNAMQEIKDNMSNELKQERLKNQWLIAQCQQRNSQIRQLKQEKQIAQQTIDKLTQQITQLKSMTHPYLNNGNSYSNSYGNDYGNESYFPKLPSYNYYSSWQQKQEPAKMSSIINISSNSKSKFVKTGKVITSIQNCTIFGTNIFAISSSFSYLIKNLYDYMEIGVIDCSYKDKTYHRNLPNFMYLQSDGMYYNGKQQCKGSCQLKTGDFVTVHFDAYKGEVRWSLNDKLVLTITNGGIKNSGIQWVTYIHLSKNCVLQEI